VRLRPRTGLWRHSDFLKLWSAQSISQLGTQVSVLAIPLAAILVLHASAFEVASLNTVDFLPFLLFSLPAGVWVDRLPRRPILVLADAGRAVALTSIPVAYALGGLTIWQLYAVGFTTGTLTVFFDVSYQSYLPSLVEREQLVDGNAKLEISRSAAQVGGPGLGGVLVGLASAPYAILVDAASYVWSALFILSIRRPESAPEPASGRSVRGELWEGLRYLVGHRLWRPISISIATNNFFSNVAWAILLVYAVRRLHLSPELIGLALALGSIGAFVGAVVVRRVPARFGVGPAIAGSSWLAGPAMLLVVFAPVSFPVPFLIGAIAIGEFSIVIFNVTAISLVQSVAPERMLGRLNASRRFIVWGVIPVGSFAGGLMASWIGLRATLLVGAIGQSFAFVPLVFSPLRSVRVMPEPEELSAVSIPLSAPTDA
jgi:MFS family permease